MPKANKVVVQFEKERETKNTFRFREIEELGYAQIGTLYIQKATIAQNGLDPDKGIKVTIEQIED